MEEEIKDFNPADDDKCPYCGSDKLDYDLVILDDENDGEIRYDVIDCSQCKKRLWEEDHD